MKIVFDLTDLYDHLTGIERYAMEVSYRMITMHPENTYVLLFKNCVHERFTGIVKRTNVRTVIIKGCNKLFFRQALLPAKLSSIKAHAYVFLAFPEPWLMFNKNVITAVHDMACWDCGENMKALSAWYFRLSNIHTFLCAKNILTISNFSKRRITEFVSESSILRKRGIEDKVRLVPCGCIGGKVSDEKDAYVLKRKYSLPDRYILTLSTVEPRKNLSLLIKAYGELIREGNDIPDLVLAGRSGWKVKRILESGEKLDGKALDKIHFIGFVADDDLPCLYRNADAFVFPSKYEGFGMPPLEALSYGARVLSSDAPALREVLSGSSWYFKNNDVNDLKDILKEILNAGKLDISLKKKYAKAVLRKYTWEKAADKLFEVISR